MIEARLTTMMAAPASAQRLQIINREFIAEVIETLGPFHETNVNIAGKILHVHDEIAPAAQTILDTLYLTWPSR